MKSPPRIVVENRQRAVQVEIQRLRCFAQLAAELAWEKRLSGAEIETLDEISVIITNDSQMARLHARFSGIPGATDVLTFQHGEIVISAETAARNARSFGASVADELRLCILHGLLHLCGYDDASAEPRRVMQRAQRALFRRARKMEQSAGLSPAHGGILP